MACCRKIVDALKDNAIIPSATNKDELTYFITHTKLPWVCLKMGDINTLASIIALLHKYSRCAMLHQDSVKGIAKDKEGIGFLKKIGVDAIITMKSQNIKIIKEQEMIAILGSFLIDSAAVDQTIANIHLSKPDIVLIMPMTVPDIIYKKIAAEHPYIVAGGLGTDHDIIQHSLDSGALACVVTNERRIIETYH